MPLAIHINMPHTHIRLLHININTHITHTHITLRHITCHIILFLPYTYYKDIRRQQAVQAAGSTAMLQVIIQILPALIIIDIIFLFSHILLHIHIL